MGQRPPGDVLEVDGRMDVAAVELPVGIAEQAVPRRVEEGQKAVAVDDVHPVRDAAQEGRGHHRTACPGGRRLRRGRG